MVIDSSAVVAVLKGEEGWPAIERALERADELRMSAVTVFECRIVLLRLSRADLFARFLRRAAVIIDPFDSTQAELAFAAHQRFGKASRHPARLNMGDCA